MEKLLTIKQVSEWLQVSPSLVYKWVHYDFVPYVKLGNFLRFRESDLVIWLKRRSHKGRESLKVQINP